jgi:hypothetical protein
MCLSLDPLPFPSRPSQHPQLPSCALQDRCSGFVALRDQPALLLGERCIDVQREFITVLSQRRDHEMDAVLHEPTDEMHVSRQSI